jgi:ubiquinone/menaquinone biosynthesis C-methylase UbiE
LLPQEPLKVLEVGCGAGLSAERIIPMLHEGSTFEGSDLLSDLTDLASERNPGITFTTESAYDLQHEDNSFDLVFGLEMLEHLDEPERALAEMKRVSRKYIIASVPREPIWRILNMSRLKYLSDLGNTPGHLNHWSTRSFKQFVSQAGTVKSVKTPLPWSQVLIEVK